MIKNQTVYAGKPRLRFKKHEDFLPPTQKLNKVHLNLGFTKLISVVSTYEFDSLKLYKIAQHTNTLVKRIYISDEGTKILGEPTVLSSYALGDKYYTVGIFSKDKEYLGDPDVGWYLYQNGLVADNTQKKIAFNFREQAWVCYTHRCSAIFKMYDMLFDSMWTPEEPMDYFDYWCTAFEELSDESKTLMINNVEKQREFAVDHIPFTKRGSAVITDLDMARQAAINFYHYIR